MRRLIPVLIAPVFITFGCDEAIMQALSLEHEPAVATPAPPPTYQEPRVTHETSGANLALEIVDDTWIQSDGGSVLGLDPATGHQVWTLEVGGAGSSGVISSMAVDGHRLIVVLDGDAVVELELRGRESPSVRGRLDVDTLGVHPRRVVRMGNDIWIIGDGGVYDFLRGEFMSSDMPIHSLARFDSRILIADGQLIRTLVEADPVTGGMGVCTIVVGGQPRVVTWHQDQEGGVLRLRGEDLTETEGAPLVVLGSIEQVIPRSDRLWVVTSREVIGAEASAAGLVADLSFPVRGGVDVAAIDDNHLAVSGTFGRAIYRIHDDSNGEGDVFLNVHRTPGELHPGTWDGRHLLAGSDEGAWRYLIGRRAELVADRLSLYGEGEAITTFGGSRVEVIEGGAAVLVHHHHGSPVRIDAGDRSRFSLVAVEDDRAWVAHDRGILMIQEQPVVHSEEESGEPEPDPGTEVARTPMEYRQLDTRIQGPITMMQPLAYGGGVAYASLHGGFGVLELVPVDQRVTAQEEE